MENRSAFRRYFTNIVGIAYNGLVHSVSKTRSMVLVKREYSVLESKIGPFSPMLRNLLGIGAKNLYYLVSKNSLVGLRKAEKGINYQERLLNRSTAVFDGIKEVVINSGLIEKLINEAVKQYEYDKKSEYMRKKMASDTPFMICDVYKDCAKDHLAYQGKVYVKDGWESYVQDEDSRARIRAYIKNHGIKTVGSVIGSPVYLMMRPYCRHKLYDVSVEKVLGNSVRKIIKDMGLEHEGGDRKTEADRARRAYLDRVEVYRDLWDVAQNPELGKELNKSKKLYKKWLKNSRR